MKVQSAKIDWLTAMKELSVGSFYLLNILYRYDIEVNDEALLEAGKVGASTYRKHKKELIDTNYLTVDQVGRGVYQYTISNGGR